MFPKPGAITPWKVVSFWYLVVAEISNENGDASFMKISIPNVRVY